MKIRKTTSGGGNKVELQMTPMIDIVFQLLVFFIFTLQIGAQEADFNVKMPLAAAEGAPDPNLLPPRKLFLTADSRGELQVPFLLDDEAFEAFPALTQYLVGFLGSERGPGSVQESAEIELHCDANLRYEFVVKAIDAVSGQQHADGSITKLVEKIKFAPPTVGG
jgi:biopolymer transport protein ExbD